jgi:phenylacetate-coenzyme A ligase PaaK-like adenylate-forming protein
MAYRQVNRELNFRGKKLEKLINKKLKTLLISAYNYVPFYKNLMREIGYNPLVDYRNSEDLKLLPVTSKKDYKELQSTYFTKEGIQLENKFSDLTSGSTGIPLRVYRDKFERALQIAKWIRVLSINGYKITDRVLSFSSPHRMNEGKTFLTHFGLLRRMSINFNLPISVLIDKFIDYNPHYLYSSTSLLNLICISLKERKISPCSNLKLIFNMGETLDENKRKFISNVLGADMVDTFGTVEAGILAYETKNHNGMHLCRDLTYYEFLDENGKPQQEKKPARLIITDLSDSLMPFIRYDHGDMVVYDYFENEDGRPEIRLVKIYGREDDYIIFPDDSKLPVQKVSEFLVIHENIKQYRFIQKKRNEVELLIAADKEYFNSISGKIYNDLLPVLKSLKLNINQVESIPLDKTGKLRQIVNQLNLP